jgi:hypothetical protein
LKRITQIDLDGFIRSFQDYTGVSASGIARLYVLAAEVLIHLVGKDWVEDNVFGKAPIDSFLKSNSEVPEDKFKHGDRVVSLAEMLFHFQNIEGIEKRIKDMQSLSVEDTVGELEGAKFLYRSNIPFRFVLPLGHRGEDFDVQAFGNGVEINCEMKTKPAETALTPATVWNTLNDNRNQLPKGRPGIMFMKIPEAWISEAEISEIIASTTKRFFRGTNRVAAVILHWEEWHFVSRGPAMRIVKFRPEVNPGSSFRNVVETEIIEKLSNMNVNHNWYYFARMNYDMTEI